MRDDRDCGCRDGGMDGIYGIIILVVLVLHPFLGLIGLAIWIAGAAMSAPRTPVSEAQRREQAQRQLEEAQRWEQTQRTDPWWIDWGQRRQRERPLPPVPEGWSRGERILKRIVMWQIAVMVAVGVAAIAIAISPWLFAAVLLAVAMWWGGRRQRQREGVR